MRERGEAVGEAELRAHRHRVAPEDGLARVERGLALVEGGLAGVELLLTCRCRGPPRRRPLPLELHAQGGQLLLDGADPLLALLEAVALRGGEALLGLGLGDGAPRGGELARDPVGTGLVLELGEAALALRD